jgi:hypothetical protein
MRAGRNHKKMGVKERKLAVAEQCDRSVGRMSILLFWLRLLFHRLR